MKHVVVAIRSSPLTTTRVHEGFRMALGLTLSNHQVTVAYTGDGAGAALALDGETVQRPGLADSLDLFEACKIREIVEREALLPAQRGGVRRQVQPVDRAGLLDLFAQADVVIPW